jgi:hypothetical protein
MYFPTRRANHGYLKLFVVAQAFVTEVLCKLFAVFNRFHIAIKFNADAIPHRNAVFHIKEKHRHTNCLISLMRGDYFKGLAETPQPWHEQHLSNVSPCGPIRRDSIRSNRSMEPVRLPGVSLEPALALKQRTKRCGDLPMPIAFVARWK